MKSMGRIPEIQKSIRMTTSFSGYNHTDVIRDGEMYNTTNLSGDRYPVLGTRRKRGITSYDTAGQESVPLTAVHGRDNLVMIRGTEVFYNFVKVDGVSVSASAATLPKKIVSMGAYVCIWPDRVYFNTVDPTDCGTMYTSITINGEDMSAIMCRNDGTDYDITSIEKGVNPPEDPVNGDFWMDESGDVDVLRQYSAGIDEWVEVQTVFVKLQGTGIGAALREFDVVEIHGIEAPAQYDEDSKIRKQALELNGSKIVYGAGDDYIIIEGLLSDALDELKDNDVSVERDVPDLDYICESNNRLWGCKYGLENGAVVNEIRACKLGDFRNWSCFMGLSTDSYTASIGTDGKWTGAISQRGYPVFFKENAIHRVSGTTPSNFSIQTTVARGVQDGSWRSVCVVNEAIYYKSRDGIMLYDGNMPVNVSEQLGGMLYSNARAGALKDKYYISMKDAGDDWNLFTYDTKRGIWYREDNLQVLQFAAVQDELYAIDEDNNTLVALAGSMGTPENDISWAAEFGISGVDYEPTQNGMGRSDIAGNHYLSRFDIRMTLEAEHNAKLEIQYDEDGHWTEQGEIHGTSMRNIMLPVIPRRCDHLRFRLSGTGEMRIYSIARHLEVGSDG